MSLRTRILSAAAVLALVLAMVLAAAGGLTLTQEGANPLFHRRTTLRLWYTDESLTDYLNEMAVSYNEAQSDYRIEPSLKSGVEYLKEINRASVEEPERLPDLYVISNDMLEQAALAGLASEVSDTSRFADNGVFPQAAIDAATYGGKIVGYPFYFETAAFLYNETYLQMMAEASGQTVQEAAPRSIMDILRLANVFNAPENVTGVFSWDVGDIFYNYYIVGDSINLGGPAGDDVSQIDVYNADAVQSLQVYQQLNQFFSIDTETVDYESVMDDFAHGRIAFTVATSDAAARMRQAREDGAEEFAYGVTRMPDITDAIRGKSVSVTYCLVVNGYSEQQAEANRFIQYMLYDHNGDFYDRTGKALAQSGYSYSDSHMDGFYEAYADSVPVSKMRQTSNFWVLLESAFAKIWNGADAGETLRALYEQTMVQVTGEPFTAEPVESPEPPDIAAMLAEE